MTVIAGSYRGWYGHSDTGNEAASMLGETRTGFRHSQQYSGRRIQFDSTGDAIADVLFKGWSVTVDFVLQEYDAEAVNMLQWNVVSGHGISNAQALLGRTKTAGRSLWELAKPLILVPCDNTINPCKRTYPKAILHPDFQIDLEFSSNERAVPIRMLILPYKYSSSGGWSPDTPERVGACEDVAYYFDTACPVPP